MRYFTFSPLEMSKEEAFQKAKPKLKNDQIVHVSPRGSYTEPVSIGKRPRPIENTYLVRVEPDEYLRIVDQSFS